MLSIKFKLRYLEETTTAMTTSSIIDGLIGIMETTIATILTPDAG